MKYLVVLCVLAAACDGGLEVGGAQPYDEDDAGVADVDSLSQALVPRYCNPTPYIKMINAARQSIGDVPGLRCQVLSGRNNDFVCDYPAGDSWPASQYLLTEIAQTPFSASGKWYVHTTGIEAPGEWAKRWRYVCSCSSCYATGF